MSSVDQPSAAACPPHSLTKRLASFWRCSHRVGSMVMGEGFSTMPLTPAAQSVGMSIRDGGGRSELRDLCSDKATWRGEEFGGSSARAAKAAKPAKVIV